MQVCIVGGIFDRDAMYRSIHRHTPETTLVDGLRARGLDVRATGHRDFAPRAGEIVHVHHIGRAAIVAAGAHDIAGFVVTPHDGRLIADSAHNTLRRRLAWRMAAAGADAVVALSKREAHAFRRVASANRIFTIPNGIPFETTAGHPQNGNPYILYVGQLIPLKGVADLLHAFSAVIKERPLLELRLAYHVAQEERVLQELASQLGIASRVEFLGPQAPAAVRVLYQHALCTVLPSYAEALPSVLIEAQLQGCPVVATDVGDVASIVNDASRLTKPGDVAGLSRAIGGVLDERDTHGTVARAERQRRMREHFGVDRMIEAHMALYQEVVLLRREGWGRHLLGWASRLALPVQANGDQASRVVDHA